jgi:hypothetical protein
MDSSTEFSTRACTGIKLGSRGQLAALARLHRIFVLEIFLQVQSYISIVNAPLLENVRVACFIERRTLFCCLGSKFFFSYTFLEVSHLIRELKMSTRFSVEYTVV